MNDELVFREARRELAGLTAGMEKRALAWLAARLPAWVTPDQLTGLGLAAMLLGGAAYAGSGRHPSLLWAVNLALALNWFGDSLDGTRAEPPPVARQRAVQAVPEPVQGQPGRHAGAPP